MYGHCAVCCAAGVLALDCDVRTCTVFGQLEVGCVDTLQLVCLLDA